MRWTNNEQRDPTLVIAIRTIVMLLGLAIIGILIGFLWVLIPEEPVTAFFISIPLLSAGIKLLRHGITGRHEAFDKMRRDTARIQDHIRNYHGDAN